MVLLEVCLSFCEMCCFAPVRDIIHISFKYDVTLTFHVNVVVGLAFHWRGPRISFRSWVSFFTRGSYSIHEKCVTLVKTTEVTGKEQEDYVGIIVLATCQHMVNFSK